MAFVSASQSVLLFGGSNGREFFEDFHVLEPVQYAAPNGDSRRTDAENQRQGCGSDKDAASDTLQLVWKRLAVSPAAASYDASFLASSFASDGSEQQSPRGTDSGDGDDANLGIGRDYHTMHYVPGTAEDERKHGYRVLVVGNIVLQTPSQDTSSAAGAAFDSPSLRVDEVRLKQPQLQAQWTRRQISSMWKPPARYAHCSALLGDQLFCFGGKNVDSTQYFGDFFYYDVALHQWREVASTGSAPSPRAFAGMAVSTTREQLFVYGGHDNGQQFGGIYLYDVALCRWDKIQAGGDKPGTRVSHSLMYVAPHHLVLFGGRKRISRRTTLGVFDLTKRTWKQLRRRPSNDLNQSQDSSQSTQSITTMTQTEPSSSDGASPFFLPPGRTAHAAVLYERPDSYSKQHILCFGGYAGSHSWLNDLYVLEIDTPDLSRLFESPLFGHSPPGSAARAPSPGSNSSSSGRASSRGSSDNACVLTDITNIAPTAQINASRSSAAASSGSGSHNAAMTANVRLLSAGRSANQGSMAGGYTPAAVAARKRRLAEVESKMDAPSTLSKKRRQSISVETTITSTSQSQSHTFEDSQGFIRTETHSVLSRQSDVSNSQDAVGLQTMLIQLLRQQQRMDTNLARVTSVVCDDNNHQSRHRDAMAMQHVFLQSQHEKLESRYDSLMRRYEDMERKAQALEKQNQALKEQLAGADAEACLYKQQSEQLIPQLTSQLASALEKTTRAQATTAQLIETKLSAIHDTIEDMRHASGERTETDDSPQKRDSIFPDDSSSSGSYPTHSRTIHTPAVLYPQTIVRELESKLHDVVQENRELRDRILTLETRLKTAEGNAQRIQELSLAFLRGQSEVQEEKSAA